MQRKDGFRLSRNMRVIRMTSLGWFVVRIDLHFCCLLDGWDHLMGCCARKACK